MIALNVQPLRELDDRTAALLRRTLRRFSEDVEGDLAAIREGLAADRRAGVVTVANDAPIGLALWQLEGERGAFAAVDILGLAEDAPGETARDLFDAVWERLAADRTLEAVGVRVRGDYPGLEEALARRGAVTFERRFMMLDLLAADLPDSTPPPGYQVAQWADEHQTEVERTAVIAQDGSVDEVVVPDAGGDDLVRSLRRLRAGTYPDMGPWLPAASLVLLDAAGRAVGYIAALDMGLMAFVVDIAVHPDCRRRGFARLLLTRSLRIMRDAGYPSVGLGVTTRNPALQLYERLGFATLQRGETAVWWRDGRQLPWREGD